jgi:hypothetical protein
LRSGKLAVILARPRNKAFGLMDKSGKFSHATSQTGCRKLEDEWVDGIDP